MRTTVRLNESVLRQARQYAVSHEMSLTALLEEALRERLSRSSANKKPRRIDLPVFDGKGLQSGVDLDDSAGLLDVMEQR